MKVRRACAEALEPRRLMAIPLEADVSFGSGGTVDSTVLNFTGATDQNTELHFLAPLAGGKTLVGGDVSVRDDNNNGNITFTGAQIARLNADGTLDKTFNQDGRSPMIPFNRVTDGLIQSDGKVVLVGQSRSGRAAAARFNAYGSIDKSFGVRGIVELALPAPAKTGVVTAVTPAPGGKLLLAADVSRFDTTYYIPAGSWIELARLTSAGRLDTTFDGDGVAVVNPVHSDTRSTAAEVNDIALLPGGKILFVGNINAGGILARFNGNGSPDTTFNPGGKFAGMIYRDDNPLMAHFNHVNKVLPLADGKILVGGEGLTGKPGDGVVARFNGDGSRDNSFAIGGARHGVGLEVFDLALDSTGAILALQNAGFISWFDEVQRLSASGVVDADFALVRTDFHLRPERLALLADGRIIAQSADAVERLTPRPKAVLTAGGVLEVTGEENFNNVISIRRAGSTVTLTRNGAVTTYPRANVQTIDLLTFAGHDTIDITSDTDWTPPQFSGSQVRGNGGRDVITLKNIDTYVESSGRLRLTADGGSIYLLITGNDAVEATFTGDTPDEIHTGGGNDTVRCGGGADTVTTYTGNDFVDLGGGNDTADGGDGNDTLLGGAGNDSIEGGDGTDSLVGGAGADHIAGNPGDIHDNDPLDTLVGF